MENTPVISAVMATYNDASFLSSSIRSVMNQTFPHWELIIVDDGSSDETASILSAYRDARIHIHRLPANSGAAAARNFAIERARGTYIAICDADDISLPDRFEKEVRELEDDPQLGVVSGQMLYFWESAPPRPVILYPEDSDAIQKRFARGRMAVPHAAVMIRKSLFEKHGGYSTACRRAEDFEWFLRVRQDTRFLTLPDFLVEYRHEVQGVSFRNWLTNLRHDQYALYLSRLGTKRRQEDYLPFERFPSQWHNLLRFYTLAWLRFVNYRLRTERASPHHIA